MCVGDKSHMPNRIGKGELVENKDNDVILNTEHDYGRVRAEYECADGINDFFGKLIRVTCTHAEFEKGPIKDNWREHIGKCKK